MKIALCLPEIKPLTTMLDGTDATYIVQGYIAQGLLARGHNLTFTAPRNLSEIIYSHNLLAPSVVSRTWSKAPWFHMTSKLTWQVQRRLGIPYLNVFSNYRFLDGYMQCLPGHELVYERNNLYHSAVAMACKRLKIPYVIFYEADQILEHDYMGKPITGLLRWRAKDIDRYNLNAAACVICVSEPAKEHLINHWSISPDKIVVFPNGVDLRKFQPYPEVKDNVRASLGIGANPMVVFVGSFYHWHDITTLLDAFFKVFEKRPDAHLVLIGDGEQRQVMMQRTTEMGIQQAVHFTGRVAHQDVPHYISAADVAVVPYPAMKQGLWLSPLKLFEYMASGTAIVASSVGQVAEVIQDGVNGFLVPPADIESMAAAIYKLIENADLRLDFGKRAREDAIRKHSWDHYVRNLESLFRGVISGRPLTEYSSSD